MATVLVQVPLVGLAVELAVAELVGHEGCYVPMCSNPNDDDEGDPLVLGGCGGRKKEIQTSHRRCSPFTTTNLMFSLSSASPLATCRLWATHSQSRISALNSLSIFTRGRAQLAPKNMGHIKRHKGRVPIPTGGSIKGTTLAYGEWGIRIRGQGARITAKQLTTAEEAIKRKIKVIKGAKVYLRVFPDIPVCVKVR